MTSHNDNRDHHDDTYQRTNGRGNSGHLLKIHSEDGEIRNCTARGALQGLHVLQHGRILKMPVQIRQVVQSVQPVEPVQAFHFGRWKDAGVWVAPGPRCCSCLSVICSGLKLTAAKTFHELAVLCRVCHTKPVFGWTRRKSQTLCFQHGEQNEKPKLEQLLPSASLTPPVETKASCFPCYTHGLGGQPSHMLLILSREEDLLGDLR